MKRKTFLKRGIILTMTTIIFPDLLTEEVEAKIIKPNFKPEPSKWKDDEINIAWIGHSTMLINFFGKIILTDPVLFRIIGLYLFGTTFGQSRYSAPALEINEIPRPDLILLSHAHMDHMDYQTLKTLTNNFPYKIDCITAFNTKDVIQNLKWKSLIELDWNDETIYQDIKIKAIETRHFGWRFPWEKDRSRGFFYDGRSYNAYLLEKNKIKILFGGDTALTDSFKKNKIETDIALMPIGAYSPWRTNHCNPEEALQMASEMKTKIFIPMHCNTFKQGMEPKEEPLNWLNSSYKNYNIELGLNQIGQTFTLNNENISNFMSCDLINKLKE